MASATTARSTRAEKLDELVATYAPIGAQWKRRRRIRRALIAGGCIVIACASVQLVISDASLLDRIGGILPQASTAFDRSEIDQLIRDRAEFTKKIEGLEQNIATMQMQKQELESRQAEFVEQSTLLARLLDEAGDKQADLEVRQQQGTQLDKEISAIAAQRKALEVRWAQFEAQGELLAMEIIAVNAQRKELESQRLQIDRQQQELAEMLERADGLYRSNSNSAGAQTTEESTTTAAGGSTFNAGSNSTLLVDNGELDTMRGGFSMGDGLDVSFGVAQTGSINGVEQFSNSFSIDSVASGFDDVDLSNMGSVLIQNGSGNFVSSGVLDSLSDSYGNVIQNTLDEQVISTTTIFDISLQNVPGAIQGLNGEQALTDSLGSF